jgi:hypothetical protein
MQSRETEEFLRNYETDLRAMTRADKGIINSLTMVAADHAADNDIRVGIVRTIEKVINTVCTKYFALPSLISESSLNFELEPSNDSRSRKS